jgi:hypothetical protein
LLCAVLASGFVLAGCDGEETVLGIDQAPGAVVEDLVDEESVVMGNDGPSMPVQMEWIDMAPAVTSSTNRMALQVTSLSQNDYKVVAKLLCNGLINKEAEVVLDEIDLAAGESVVISVDAVDLPIQTMSGAAQARFELSLSRETEAGTSETRLLTPVVYYRHGASYEGLQVFDERALMEQHGGRISGIGAGLEESGQVLGRVANVEGAFDEVKLMDNDFAVKQGGKIIGWESGMDISLGQAEDLAEVVK